MVVYPNGNLLTAHFDIGDSYVILDVPIGDSWALLTFQNHKLVEFDSWKLPFPDVVHINPLNF